MHMVPWHILEQHWWPIAQVVPGCWQARQFPPVQRLEQHWLSLAHPCPLGMQPIPPPQMFWLQVLPQQVVPPLHASPLAVHAPPVELLVLEALVLELVVLLALVLEVLLALVLEVLEAAVVELLLLLLLLASVVEDPADDGPLVDALEVLALPPLPGVSDPQSLTQERAPLPPASVRAMAAIFASAGGAGSFASARGVGCLP
jgi:hypothetical protein